MIGSMDQPHGNSGGGDDVAACTNVGSMGLSNYTFVRSMRFVRRGILRESWGLGCWNASSAIAEWGWKFDASALHQLFVVGRDALNATSYDIDLTIYSLTFELEQQFTLPAFFPPLRPFVARAVDSGIAKKRGVDACGVDGGGVHWRGVEMRGVDGRGVDGPE